MHKKHEKLKKILLVLSEGRLESGEIHRSHKDKSGRAFEDLCREYHQLILKSTYKILIDKDSYKDATQEVEIKLYRGIGNLRNPDAFYGYLHTLIHNTCADFNRKYIQEFDKGMVAGYSDEPLENMPEESMDFDPVSSDVIIRNDNEALLDMVLNLPESYRKTVILRYYADYSYQEIADTLGVSVQTVGSNLIRAKLKLKKQYLRRERKAQNL